MTLSSSLTGPAPTPRASDGGPLRVNAPARRRLLAGEPVASVSAAWPAMGERCTDGRVALRPVTFVADAPPGHTAMLHLNGVTDSHRDDIRPALMDQTPDPTVRTITYLLPDDLVASYRFAVGTDLDPHAGRTREGWLRIHALGVPDPRNPQRLPNPLGATSSVLLMPGARVHPAWRDAASAGRAWPDGDLEPRVLPGDPGAEVVILFDAEWWLPAGVEAAFARRPGARPTVVLVPSGPLARRAEVLPHPHRAAALVEDVALPAARTVVGRVGSERVVVAGQSYGGLAAAAVATLRPDLAGRAVVQSGSFRFRAGEDARPPAGRLGDLVHRLKAASVPGSFVVQVGTEEPDMRAGADAFVERARRGGADVVRRDYAGGHDYAWWRTGLFDALDVFGV